MEDAKSFETALCELEDIVKKLDGDVSLDEAVKSFEKGVGLCKICMESLKAEKGKLKLLTDDLDKLTEEFKID